MLNRRKRRSKPPRLEHALRASEVRYRRLFEAAQDGILILDADTGRITDVNPFLTKLLGHGRDRFLGKRLWEIGLFQDVEKSRIAFKQLMRDGYIRYEDLPLETSDGRSIDVEFVSNIYRADGARVIQCNIRDITERKHVEVERAILDTVEGEQRRIGQDLHDGLCQELTGVALLAKALSQKLAATAPAQASEATEIAGLVNRAIDQTRSLARGLSPVEIEDGGLLPALQNFAATMERIYPVSCLFTFDERAVARYPYTPRLATHLYRIAQEAISNAVLHGKAKRMSITLTTVRGRGILTIQDDGVGIAAGGGKKSGMGLRSMRYRTKMIGGHLKVDSGACGGTVVTCFFPRRTRARSLNV